MSRWIAIFSASILWLAGLAFADVAKVAALNKDESIVVNVHYEGTVPKVTSYTFTPGNVTVAEGGKDIGNVSLTADEQAQVDRFLDLVRNGRFGTGNGTSTYVIKFMRKDRERKGMGETHRIIRLQESKEHVLQLPDLKRRATK